jgi:hypothetical protein
MIQQPLHHYTWSQHCIWWLCSQFGALTILSCIIAGAIVIIFIVFRKFLREKIGDFLQLADEYVNGKK